MNHCMKNQQRIRLEEPKNYETKYFCEKCRDATYILIDDEAIPCSCKEIRLSQRILAESGISEEFAKKTFENFDYSKNVQIINSYTVARSFVKDFDNIKNSRCNSIIFMGSIGGGKTHLSLSIANELMKSGVGVVYMGYRDSVVKIKQKIMDSIGYERLISRYKNCKVLLIDDLFKGSVSASDLNILFEIVNHRYFNNLSMIISSERCVDELLDIDEAIGSRILEMCGKYKVELKGNKLNYRIYG